MICYLISLKDDSSFVLPIAQLEDSPKDCFSFRVVAHVVALAHDNFVLALNLSKCPLLFVHGLLRCEDPVDLMCFRTVAG